MRFSLSRRTGRQRRRRGNLILPLLGLVSGIGMLFCLAVMAYEMESLQALVFHAMLDAGLALTWGKEEDMDLAHRVAGNMVQVSHLAYPDLAGTFDHSTQWRKK